MRRVACFAVCFALGCATPIEQRPWHRVATPHFEIVGEVDPARMLEIAGRLELLRAVLANVGVDANLEPRVPFLVYVFGDAASFSRFRWRSGLTGFALPRTHRTFLAIEGGADAMEAGAVALHEYVHFVLSNGEATHYPAWYEEGLAEFLSTLSVEDGRVVLARIPPERAHWLRYGSPLGLRRVMTAYPYEWSDRTLARFYAESWALAHFFYVADRAGYPKRQAQLVRYIRLLNRGIDPDAACKQAFGQDFEGLEREFLRYVGEGTFPYLGLPLEGLEVPEQRSSGALPESEKRYLLGELALAVGEEWRGEAQRWFELAVEAGPEDARAHAALGLTLAAGDGRGADAHLERALALGEADPEVQRRVGEALLERASNAGDDDDPVRLVEQARHHFRRSLELDPGQVPAHAGLGQSYLVGPAGGDPAEGLAALRTAHERLPADREIAFALASLELRAGAIERARALLAHLPVPTHGDPASVAEQLAIERAREKAGLPPPAPVGTRHLEARLDVAAPDDGARVRGGSGWTLVEGRGGLSEAGLYDVLIAIDESSSTLSPAGTDVDGDGTVGRKLLPDGMDPDSACSDPGDTVIRAELEAARVLIRQLPESTIRVGLVTFGGNATLHAPLGAPAAAAEALEAYRVHVDLTGTSLANALAYSMQEFFEQREVGTRRQRAILLLSDGQPTVPSKLRGQREALELAHQLGELGVPVHAFALGKEALEEPEFYRSLAERSGGRFVPVERPAEVVSHLAELRLSGLDAVAIRNESSGEAARALRLFPDGTFDAYVPLVEGENRIAITASIEGGRSLDATRTVHFERPAEPTAEDRRAAEELRQEIETRGVELDLLAEIRRRREQAAPTSRELEVEVER